MAYFTEDFITFFEELKANNNKEWFHKNKKRYENSVKNPFIDLLTDLLFEVKKLDPEIEMEPKEAMFRINRDVRFSQDKSPYNTMIKAGFSKGGRKSPYAGYYLAISADNLHIGGGSYMMDREAIESIRKHIAKNADELAGLLADKKFSEKFDGIKGEAIKRIPEEYKAVYEKMPLIANKQFYYMADYPAHGMITNNDLLPFIIAHCEASLKVNRFLKAAL